jgi:hypothetical protein
MEIGRGLMPSSRSSARYADTCAAICAEVLPSSCQQTIAGNVLVLRAWVRNERIQFTFQLAALGPTIGVTASRARTRWNVRTQPSLKLPAAPVFQVKSGSFHSSYASTLDTLVAAIRAFTIWSTLASQSFQLTHW